MSQIKPAMVRIRAVMVRTGLFTSGSHIRFGGGFDTRFGSHKPSYVNPFVRELRSPRWLRISSTVDGPRPVTGIVGNPALVASDFNWIPSPCSDGFRFGA